MSSVLDEMLDKIKEGAVTIADKTDEYTRIGKLKVEMVSLKRNTEATFTALGAKAYHLIVNEKQVNITKDEEVKNYIEKIKDLEKEMTDKKEKIEQIKEEKAAERKKRADEKEKNKEEEKTEETAEEPTENAQTE